MLKTLFLTALSIGIGTNVFADPESAKKAPPEKAKPRLDNYSDPLPEEALARFGTVYLRAGMVGDFRYSPDEKTMAIMGGGYRFSLGLWDVASGKQLHCFNWGEEDFINAIAFSPDGKTLAEGGFRGDIRLWDAQSAKLIRTLKGNTEIRSIVYGVDGKTVISAIHNGRRGRISFWDVGTGAEIAKIEKSVWSLSISKDGKLLASAGRDHVVRVWDAKTREQLMEFDRLDGLAGLVFSPDGRQLAVANYSGPSFVFDAIKGEVVHKLGEGIKDLNSVAYSPNGKLLAASSSDKNGTIHLWDSETGKEVRSWETLNDHLSLHFSRDGKFITSSCSDESTVRFWDVETGKEIRPAEVHRAPPTGLELSSDGKSLWSIAYDQRAIRWNIASARPEEVIPCPSELHNTLPALSPGATLLAVSSPGEEAIHVVDLQTRKDVCPPLKMPAAALDRIRDYIHYGGKMNLKFSPDGKILVLRCHNELFYLWKWQTDRNPKELQLLTNDNYQILFTPDGKYIVTSSYKNCETHWWDVNTGKKIFSLSDKDNPYLEVLAISPDGRWIISTKGHEGLKVIDSETRKIVREIAIYSPWPMIFSPDGHVLAFEKGEKRNSNVDLVEFISGETIATYKGQHSGISALQFSPDSRAFYSGAGDSTILKWDATGRHGKGPSTPSLAAAWDALILEAIKSYPAGWDFVDAPKDAVVLLRKRIIPEKVDAKVYQQLVDDLDAKEFRKREKTSEILKSMGFSVEELLKKSLETEKRPEVRERLQKVMDELKGSSFLRMQRAMQVLERINNEESRKLLKELAEGPAESMLTREALVVLKRMKR